MRYETFIGFRHLGSLRGSFLSTLTVLAMVGVALSVCLFTTVVSVAGGFVDSFRERVLGVNPHIVVTKFGVYFSEYERVEDAIQSVSGVESTSPYVLYEMLATSRNSRARPGALVRGTRLSDLLDNDDLRAMVVAGALEDLGYDGQLGDGFDPAIALVPIAMGDVLAERLDVEIGDVVTLLSPARGLAAIGVDTGRDATVFARFEVRTIIHSGFYDYDNRLILVDYRALQDLYARGDVVTGIEVRIEDVDDTDRIRDEIEAQLTTNRYRALDWRQVNRNLFASLNLQKLALTIVMTCFVLVASSVILSVLVMLVLEKRRDIAVLRSMGATRGSILRIFIVEGMTIGTVGTSFGLILGYVVCRIIEQVDFGIAFEVYRIDGLPVAVNPFEFALAGLGTLLICFLATLYPAWRASQVAPVDALRYD